MEAVILCGGRGMRLGALSANTPKPLLPVGGAPFLHHLLTAMRHEGVTRVVLSAHYLAEQFEAFVRHAEVTLPELELVIEPTPLGTGGGLRYAVDHVRSSTFVARNGDSWCPQLLAPVLEEHRRLRRRFTAVVVPASQVTGGALNKGTWEIGPDGAIRGFTTAAHAAAGWVNAGLYVIERALASRWPAGAYSLEAQLPVLLQGEAAGVFCADQPLLDIGTPACYDLAPSLMSACSSRGVDR